MANLNEISNQVLRFLSNEISLEAFEDWSAEQSWNIHRDADQSVRDLSYQIRGILNAHADDESDNDLRMELAQAVFPFLESEIHVGESPLAVGESSASYDEVMAPAA